MKVKSKGAFYQDTDGIWGIDTRILVDGEYRHFKKKGYATLSAAKADFERAKAEFIKSKTKHHEVMLFEELWAEYEKMRKVVVDISTIQCDLNVLHHYLAPYFGHKLLKDCLNREAIYDWYHNLVDTTKYSNQMKSKVITRMKDLLKFAYMHEFIDAPTYQSCDVQLYQVKYSKQAKTERIVWTREEENAFFSAIEGSTTDFIMFRLFFTISPRLGEFLGLQPNCFDYAKKKVTIKQQAKNVTGHGVVVTDKLKTHDSYRTVIIDSQLADMLHDYIVSMDIKDDEFLFYGNTKSQPLSRTSFRRKLYKYCDLAGVRKINPHASRHLQATKLASVCHTGEEIEAAARRLGHSPETFMNTYARHTSDKTENELLERMAEA